MTRLTVAECGQGCDVGVGLSLGCSSVAATIARGTDVIERSNASLLDLEERPAIVRIPSLAVLTELGQCLVGAEADAETYREDAVRCVQLMGRRFSELSRYEWPISVVSGGHDMPVIQDPNGVRTWRPEEMVGRLAACVSAAALPGLESLTPRPVVVSCDDWLRGSVEGVMKDANKGLWLSRVVSRALCGAVAHDIRDGTVLVAFAGGASFSATLLALEDGFAEVLAHRSAGETSGGEALTGHLVGDLLQSGQVSSRCDVPPLRRACEEAKVRLSDVEAAEVVIVGETPAVVTRDSFELLCGGAIDQAARVVAAVASAGGESNIPGRLVLSGGGFRVPALRDAVVQAVADVEVFCGTAPENTVAQGAAMIAGRIALAESQRRQNGLDTISELERAAKAKDKGNEHFLRAEYQDAAREWKLGFRLMESLPDAKDIDDSGTNTGTLRLTCALNLAQCYLNLGDHARAVFYSSEALIVDPKSVKALYRRARARISLGEHGAAGADLGCALALSPQEPQLVELRRKLERSVRSPNVDAKIFEDSCQLSGRDAVEGDGMEVSLEIPADAGARKLADYSWVDDGQVVKIYVEDREVMDKLEPHNVEICFGASTLRVVLRNPRGPLRYLVLRLFARTLPSLGKHRLSPGKRLTITLRKAPHACKDWPRLTE